MSVKVIGLNYSTFACRPTSWQQHNKEKQIAGE